MKSLYLKKLYKYLGGSGGDDPSIRVWGDNVVDPDYANSLVSRDFTNKTVHAISIPANESMSAMVKEIDAEIKDDLLHEGYSVLNVNPDKFYIIVSKGHINKLVHGRRYFKKYLFMKVGTDSPIFIITIQKVNAVEFSVTDLREKDVVDGKL